VIWGLPQNRKEWAILWSLCFVARYSLGPALREKSELGLLPKGALLHSASPIKGSGLQDLRIFRIGLMVDS